MKLFLTSAGLTNNKIAEAFSNLVGLPSHEIKIAFIPTASNVEEGDKGWLIDDYTNLRRQDYNSVDIVDISALPQEIWKPRLELANVLFLGGGNTFHLMHWVKESGLEKMLPDLLKTRVYAGISAGSCIAGPTIYNSVQNLFGEKYNLKIEKGLGLVNFQFIPHLNSKYFPKIRKQYLEDAAKDLTEPIYAVDDETALMVRGDKIEVISEGKWSKFN
ncbi:MAG: Type 1 glutamine amidotransferase-like domain-containing protein [bacterium]|nr:Type 1 glutamine amidotransferase-like domain-containing protein [bacterium]